jgi:hypothetical protein
VHAYTTRTGRRVGDALPLRGLWDGYEAVAHAAAGDAAGHAALLARVAAADPAAYPAAPVVAGLARGLWAFAQGDAARAAALLVPLAPDLVRLGGVVGVRDVDFGATLPFPLTPRVEQARPLLYRILEHNGGNPWLGRTHRRLLRDAGFARSAAGATAQSAGTPEETRRAAALMKAVWQGAGATALAEGWADREALDAMLAEIDAWAEQPDAFWTAVSCHAVGWAGD